ncbi:hypothetical protein ACO0SA_001131 [Hanseniaspora valbyensis]
MAAIKLKLKGNNKTVKSKKKTLFDNNTFSKELVNNIETNDEKKKFENKIDLNEQNLDSFLNNIPEIIIKDNSNNKRKLELNDDELEDSSDDDDNIKNKKPSNKIKNKKKKIIQNNHFINDIENNNTNTTLVHYETLGNIDLIKLKLDKQIDLQIISEEGREENNGNIPKPLYDWIDFGIPPVIYTNFINNLQFNKPTMIQAISYPIITNNLFNFIGISPTGTGKTLSYILPIIKKMILSDTKKESISVIIAPTRELTQQIHNQFIRYLHKIDLINLILTNPGQDISKEIALVKKCSHNNSKFIIISTPGRLIDLMTLNNGSLINLNNINNIVMDECDRLLDLGFAPQVKNILNSVTNNTDCCKMMFSATMPSFLEKFAYKMLSSASNKTLIKCTVGGINKCKETILQKVIIVSDEVEKYQQLLSLIETNPNEPLVIFVKTQLTCDDIGSKIDSKFYKDNNIYLLHAGRSDTERVQVIEDFKLNCIEFKKNRDNKVYKRPILFCTQLLSRGLDIPEINMILIYNALNSESQYVHTVGRTGRFDNEKGVCITLLNEMEIDCAQVLYKQIINYSSEKSFLNMDKNTVETLTKMNSNFWKGVENGKFKNIDQGFTGKGLMNFKKNGLVEEEVNNEEDEDDITLETSDILFDKKLSKYHQSISIDSLPQFIKRDLVKAANLDKIRKKTGSVITLTGSYKIGKGVLLNVTNEDKLTVLETMVVLNDAFNSLKEKYIRQQQQKFSI